jgi:hypothetical protein
MNESYREEVTASDVWGNAILIFCFPTAFEERAAGEIKREWAKPQGSVRKLVNESEVCL